MGRWQSGQMHETVNLASQDYAGSNPARPTYINIYKQINITVCHKIT